MLEDLEVQIEETAGSIQIGRLPEIKADKIQMRQLFQNLISNGLKYRKPDTAPKIFIKYSANNNGDGFHKISIEDNGIGFEQKYGVKIFEPFQRLHSDSNISGTGMGLYICKKIVTRHNGTISAESDLTEGTKITISLPEKQA